MFVRIYTISYVFNRACLTFYRPHLVVIRRTPLDDAIVGKYWKCAKLLFCFGAKHTVELDEEAQKQLDGVSMDEIRALVRSERVGSRAEA